MDPDKIYDELKTIRVMLASVMENMKSERDRVTRELELAKIIHERHDHGIEGLNKLLKGNGEKGLIEQHRDLKEEVSRIRGELVERRALVDERLKSTQDDQRWLVRSIIGCTIALVITLAITSLAGGG